MSGRYKELGQSRTIVETANTWTEIVIPIGAINPLITVDGITVFFRISTVNTLNPETQGSYISATGGYNYEGVNSAAVSLYISTSIATTATLQWTAE